MPMAHPVSCFKALADETRLRILHLLRDRELAVGEIVGILQTGQSRISHHLRILTEAGFLTSRRDGLWMFYTVAEQARPRRLVECAAEFAAGFEPLDADRARVEQVLRERKRSSTRFFNSLAGRWESMKREMVGGLDLEAEIRRRIPAWCRAVADLGCGTGDLLCALAGTADRLIGVDSSPRMLEKARARLGERVGDAARAAEPAETERFDLRMGELEHLPMGDAEADCALINMVLHHLADPLQALKEARRVVASGGTLIVAELEKHENEAMRTRYGDRWLGFDKRSLERWIRKAGFSVGESAVLPALSGLSVLMICCTKEERE